MSKLLLKNVDYLVTFNDKDEILSRLNALINKSISVRILDADRKANKLIFSEKEAIKDGLNERFESMKIGDMVEGVVTQAWARTHHPRWYREVMAKREEKTKSESSTAL